METSINNEHTDTKQNILKRAIDFANTYHSKAKQYRTGPNGEKLPYIDHIYEVIKILINDANITEPKILTVAALHDVVEDTECSLDEIKEIFGDDISEAVDLMSKHNGESFEEYSKRLFTNKKYPWVGIIKLADRIHNLRTYPYVMNTEKLKRKYDETVTCIKPYAEAISPILNQKLDEGMRAMKTCIDVKELQEK